MIELTSSTASSEYPAVITSHIIDEIKQDRLDVLVSHGTENFFPNRSILTNGAMTSHLETYVIIFLVANKLLYIRLGPSVARNSSQNVI